MILHPKQRNSKKIYLFLSLSVFFLIINLLPFHLTNEQGWHSYEKFDEKAQSIQTINSLIKVIDDSARSKNIKEKTLDYNEIITLKIKQRFRHGYSHYALNENWIACLSGYFIWRDLSAIVDPEDLMKYPNAACSQQSIIMMEILKIKNIPFCKVGWNHHFTLCAWVENGWHYYDPNMEPIITIEQRKFNDNFLNIEFLAQIYKGRINKNEINGALGVPQLGKFNEFPAPRALIFHKATKIISITFWLLFLIPVIFWYRPIHILRNKYKRKKTNINRTKINAKS